MVSLMMLACGERMNAENQGQAQQAKDYVEVLYFHGKQRCATCVSIEKNTKELLNAKFAGQMKGGSVKFRTIDISRKENEQIADKYQVTWSSLFLVRHKGGKEQAEDLTKFAFANSRTAPEKFKSGVESKINQALK